MSKEFYKKYRPTGFNRVYGQDAVCSVLEKYVQEENLPHTLLFTGASGCGKTTLARILRKKLNCHDGDFYEVNAADFNGVNTIRDIRTRMNLASLNGTCRVWLIDECHQLTGQAQNAFLKMLEDTPDHVYFFLATTDPQKLIKTIKTRCTEVAVRSLGDSDFLRIAKHICKRAKIQIPSKKVLAKMVECSEGSARKFVVFLDQVAMLDTEAQQLEIVIPDATAKKAFELCRLLINTKTNWRTVGLFLKEIKHEDPEGIRYMVLAYMATVLTSSGKTNSRAFACIEIFQDNFYDSKFAGLVKCCYEVIND